MTRKTLIILIGLTLLAAVLRFAFLSSNPPSLNVDEVGIGYNAYSILKTGRDEFGTPFPIAFRAIDDYKASLYIYLTAIPIQLFGPTAFAIRFVSALVGTLTIPLAYFVTKELLKGSKTYRHVPLITAALVAISPWHIQFSRGAFESNLSTFLAAAALLCFLKGIKNAYWWFPSAVLYSLTLYAYHTPKLFIPLFGLVLAFVARKQIIKHKLMTALAIILFLVLTAPLISFSLSPEGQLRFQGTSIFKDSGRFEEFNNQQLYIWRNGFDKQARILHSKPISYATAFVTQYLKHFNPEFLFTDTGMPKNHAPNVGLLYLFELPLLIAGVAVVLLRKVPNKPILLAWILLVPIAAAMTWDAPSSVRTLMLIPALQIVIAIGLVSIIKAIRSKHRRPSYVAASLIAAFFIILFIHNYFFIAPFARSQDWQYGNEQAAKFAQQNIDNYEQIIVSPNLHYPHIFFVLHTGYDPATYLNSDGGTVSGSFDETNNAFAKYRFTNIGNEKSSYDTNTLYIDKADRTPKFAIIQQQIDYINGEPAITIYTVEPDDNIE